MKSAADPINRFQFRQTSLAQTPLWQQFCIAACDLVRNYTHMNSEVGSPATNEFAIWDSIACIVYSMVSTWRPDPDLIRMPFDPSPPACGRHDDWLSLGRVRIWRICSTFGITLISIPPYIARSRKWAGYTSVNDLNASFRIVWILPSRIEHSTGIEESDNWAPNIRFIGFNSMMTRVIHSHQARNSRKLLNILMFCLVTQIWPHHIDLHCRHCHSLSLNCLMAFVNYRLLKPWHPMDSLPLFGKPLPMTWLLSCTSPFMTIVAGRIHCHLNTGPQGGFISWLNQARLVTDLKSFDQSVFNTQWKRWYQVFSSKGSWIQLIHNFDNCHCMPTCLDVARPIVYSWLQFTVELFVRHASRPDKIWIVTIWLVHC